MNFTIPPSYSDRFKMVWDNNAEGDEDDVAEFIFPSIPTHLSSVVYDLVRDALPDLLDQLTDKILDSEDPTLNKILQFLVKCNPEITPTILIHLIIQGELIGQSIEDYFNTHS